MTYETITANGSEFRVYSQDMCGMDFVDVRRDGFDGAETLLLSGKFAGTEVVERYNAERKAGRSQSIFVRV